MPRLKNNTHETAVGSRQLVINFQDDATQWFQNLTAAVAARPQEIEVQFVGGCVAPPYEIIALRNALLGIPRSIRLVTTALVSLPPLTCAAWLVGDVRRIARDAVVWIPELPDNILRHGLRCRHRSSNEGVIKRAASEGGSFSVDEDDLKEGDGAENVVPFGRRRSVERERCERDLRTLADAINEWFPCFEFRGTYLTFDDLIAWDVVKPEWCFGGRGVRNRPEDPANNGLASVRVKKRRVCKGMKNSRNADAQAPVNCGKVEFDGHKPGESTKGEYAPSKDESNGSGAPSEPGISSKPSDLRNPE